MKKIGIDGRLYSQTGVGTYLRNFIYELSRIKVTDLNFYIYVLPQDRKKVIGLPSHFILRDAPYRWHTMGEQIGFLRAIQKDNLDLMHFTYFGYPVFYRRKFIVTVHDITPLLFKTGKASTKNPLLYLIKHFFFQHILRLQIERAQFVITPSNAVKKQIKKQFTLSEDNKIKTFYEGIGHELMIAKENLLLSKEFKEPFFIYVGNFYPHKNIERLIEAFSKVRTSIKLILIGPRDYFTSIISGYIQKLGMTEKIVIFDHAETQDLVFFYKHAQALIHPSLSEGFGLPLIEAAYFNCPILASDTPVLKELLGNEYTSFDPYNTDDIWKSIEEFLKNPPRVHYEELLKKYSFKTMTQQTLSLYIETLKRGF